jgi:hypothetical protein
VIVGNVGAIGRGVKVRIAGSTGDPTRAAGDPGDQVDARDVVAVVARSRIRRLHDSSAVNGKR